MMKFVFCILFIFPLCFINNFYWMVQNMLLLLSFLFIMFKLFL